MQQTTDFLLNRGLDFVVQLCAAIALLILGRWAIAGLRVFVRKALEHKKLDVTLALYIDTALGVLLTVLLAIAALGVIGIETTSLAGLLAAGGVAIGVAWSGLLSNLAAGVFMVILRPFKKGDTVSIGGVLGEVEKIGIFGTTLTAPDSTTVIVGNTKAFNDNIHNLSAVPHRRIDARIQLPWACDPQPLYDAVLKRLAADPRVLKVPEPRFETVEHTTFGPVGAARPFCAPSDYSEVVFLTNRILAEEIKNSGLPTPNSTGPK